MKEGRGSRGKGKGVEKKRLTKKGKKRDDDLRKRKHRENKERR